MGFTQLLNALLINLWGRKCSPRPTPLPSWLLPPYLRLLIFLLATWIPALTGTQTNICTCMFPGGASGKQPTCQCSRCKRHWFDLWVEKIPWRRAWQATPVSSPGESHGQRSLAGYSLWSGKESDTSEAT